MAELKQGPPGREGPPGPPGPPGPAGMTGAAGRDGVDGTLPTITSDGNIIATVKHHEGDVYVHLSLAPHILKALATLQAEEKDIEDYLTTPTPVRNLVVGKK